MTNKILLRQDYYFRSTGSKALEWFCFFFELPSLRHCIGERQICELKQRLLSQHSILENPIFV